MMETMGMRYTIDAQVSLSVATPWRRKCSNHTRSRVKMDYRRNKWEMCMHAYIQDSNTFRNVRACGLASSRLPGDGKSIQTFTG